MDKEKEEIKDIKSKKEDEKSGEVKKKTEKKKGSKKSVAKDSKKIKELEEKLKEVQKEAENYKDRLLRTAAEFENYKRRTEKESLQLLLNANEELIKKLLPVIDDLALTIKHGEKTDKESLLEGITLVYKKFMSILEQQGLKEMKAKGEEFDPEKHDAMMQVESDEYESGYITEEHLKGYTLNDKVIRHAQVLVAK